MEHDNYVISLNSCNFRFQKTVTSEEIVMLALRITSEYIHGKAFEDPDMVKRYLRLQLAPKGYEVFAVIFLDASYRMLSFEEMFRGTINSASVYPREVVKEALQRNAAAVIFAHNHTSGVVEPSDADKKITTKLQEALQHFDIRVLDHFIVGKTNEVTSFAERGLL